MQSGLLVKGSISFIKISNEREVQVQIILYL